MRVMCNGEGSPNNEKGTDSQSCGTEMVKVEYSSRT
jgi:hypothetical protein